MTSVVHDSRRAPRCVDCAHFQHDPAVRRGYCNHPVTPVDLVDGRPAVSADAMRNQGSRIAYACGTSGSLFVARGRPSEPCTKCGGRGFYRAPFERELTACPDCLIRPISTASEMTASSVTLPESKA